MAVRELDEGSTALAYPAMAELRPQIGSVGDFVGTVDQAQRPAGYRLVGSFEAGCAEAVAVAGFRTGRSLGWGPYLYVDDLVSIPAFRGRGHARRLLEWLLGEASRLGCAQVHLDSGTHRHTAHRLYLQTGFRISAFHFVLDLPRGASWDP